MSSSSGLIPNPRDASSGKPQTLGLNCPLCKKAFQVTAEMLGKKVVCPHCKKQIATPSPNQVKAKTASKKKGGEEKKTTAPSEPPKVKKRKSASPKTKGESPTEVSKKRKRSKSTSPKSGTAKTSQRQHEKAPEKTGTKSDPPVLPPAVATSAQPSIEASENIPTAPPVIPPAPPVVPVVGASTTNAKEEAVPDVPPVLAPVVDQDVVTVPPANLSESADAKPTSSEPVPPPVNANLLTDAELVEPSLEGPPESQGTSQSQNPPATLLTDEELVEPSIETPQDEEAVSAVLVESPEKRDIETVPAEPTTSDDSLLPPMVGDASETKSEESNDDSSPSEGTDLLPPSADSSTQKKKATLKQVAIPNEGEEADPFATAPEDEVLLPDGEGGFVKSSSRYVTLESGEDKVQLRRLDRKQKNAVRSLKSIIIYGLCIAMLVGAIIVLQVIFGGGGN